MNILPFQQKFIKAVYDPKILTAILSIPRGNGKSTLSGWLLSKALTPGDPLYVKGAESVLVSGSIEQARIVFRVVRFLLGEETGAYRYLDSATRCGITHVDTNTRLRVHGSNAKTAMGFLNVPLVVWDEPGAAETIAGQRMLEAIETAMGKPGSRLKFVGIGTLAPAHSGFWHDLVKSKPTASKHITLLQGDGNKWDQWQTIRKANPLMVKFAESRKVLLSERNAARRDAAKKSQFLSYRLNLPTLNENEALITPEQWQTALKRKVADREGSCVLGVDLGANRAWTAAVAMWESGRVEALAFAPGIPDMRDQERRDGVSGGLYQKLADQGTLIVAEGRQVPDVSYFLHECMERFGYIGAMVCDRFRLAELEDAAGSAGYGGEILPVVTQWREGAQQVRSFRSLALDGVEHCQLSIEPKSAALITASISVAQLQHDQAGNCRLIKSKNNTARDDVAAAMLLASDELKRVLNEPEQLDEVIAF